jgi:hypothetical protein
MVRRMRTLRLLAAEGLKTTLRGGKDGVFWHDGRENFHDFFI